ncbi:single-strand binding protein [Thalassoporum mexicanum PCC 7367]|uniref:single-stranded DNA-binding protein n=1 Tax=Thalassoporum mexicanum TaxID=3457544 RepID=UPI00029FEC61|nr:single-stranded DNA-binding protein [Pseudanabaena sp. PCC 7367]AFY69933.1 single-strand binding protein [Pseudanabaena sp. PCC 7367]
MSLNLINLVGRTGRDPDVKYFESGSVKCSVSLAVDRRSRNRDEPPDWFELEMWGRTAEVAANYVKKGKLIGITGSLKLDRWQDRSTGEDRQKPIILVNRLELLGSRRDNENSGGGYDDDF